VPAASLPYGALTTDDIGNVSARSLPFHQRHIAALSDTSSGIMQCKVLEADDILFEHFRIHHPVQSVRTMCNIMIGLRKFCRAQVLSGDRALKTFFSDLHGGSLVQISSHQREIAMALKLLIVSATRGTYSYGVTYCRNLAIRNPSSSKSLNRTLRLYKLISYVYPLVQHLLGTGEVDIRQISAIRNELETREVRKYQHRPETVAPSTIAVDDEFVNAILEGAMDKLFSGLEQYSQTLVEIGTDLANPVSLQSTLEEASLVFDLGIEERINTMIERLQLIPSGPRGIIDLGDEDMPEDPDW